MTIERIFEQLANRDAWPAPPPRVVRPYCATEDRRPPPRPLRPYNATDLRPATLVPWLPEPAQAGPVARREVNEGLAADASRFRKGWPP